MAHFLFSSAKDVIANSASTELSELLILDFPFTDSTSRKYIVTTTKANIPIIATIPTIATMQTNL